MASDSSPRRVGIVGFGKLGHYLVDAIVKGDAPGLGVAFVWNRSPERVAESKLVRADQHCRDLSEFARFEPDLIVEVAHPEVTREFGPRFVRAADFMIGSPTALADRDIERSLHEAVADGPGFGVYVPSGALWGAQVRAASGAPPIGRGGLKLRSPPHSRCCQDLRKMADRGQLGALTVTMKKHPGSLKVVGGLVEPCRRAAEAGAGETVLYDGPVRALCSLAPNNVNTMAAAAVAGNTLGMDRVRGRSALHHHHQRG